MPRHAAKSLRSRLYVSAALIAFLSVVDLATAQQIDTTMLSGTTVTDGGVVTLDLPSSDVQLRIPIRTKAGGFNALLVGSFHVFVGAGIKGSQWQTSTGTSFNGANLDGGSLSLSAEIALSVSAAKQSNTTCNELTNDTIYSELGIIDPNGTWHPLPSSDSYDSMGCYKLPATSVATDGSGYTLLATSSGGPGYVYDKGGNKFSGYPGSVFNFERTDPDNNTVYNSCSGTGCVFTDTLNTTAITAEYNQGPNQTTGEKYTYNDASGHVQTYTVTYSLFNRQSAFGCGTQVDRELPTGPVYLPTQLSTPTGAFYTISYEQTPGAGSTYTTTRIAKVTFPSGGYVSYGYSDTTGNNGINCTSGVVPTVTRTVNDNNGNTKSWTYVNSLNSKAAGNFTVTETDPAGNQSVYNFSGSAVDYQFETYDTNPDFLTQVKSYQGPATGTPLKTVLTCYNGNTSSCATPSIVPTFPITERDVYTSLTTSSSNRVKTTYDATYGNLTSSLAYDFGASTPTWQAFSFYGQSWNGSNACSSYASGTYIYNTPCYSHTENTSGTDVSKTQITYSNTGHPTSTQKWTGSSWLTTSASYNSNGTVATAHDVSGNLFTYAYNGTGGCSSPLFPLLPTSVTADGLTTSTQWDCNGGVATQSTDPNGQPTGYVHNDPLWRVTSMTDPLGNVVTYSYSPTTIEGAMNFNGATSTSDRLGTGDGLGRQIFAQIRQAHGSSTLDSTQTVYGWNSTGPFTTQSVAYSGTAAQSAPSGTPVTTTQYDALGRPLTVSDGGGGTISYTYPQNDVLSVLSPLPTGENNKEIQNEYDGLGRLTSSCAISGTVSGSTSCNQKNGSYSGVLTTTSYTSASGSQTISSTRGGSQTRTQIVDGLGRVTLSTTPEGGTTSYVYDSYPAGECDGWTSQPGQLMLVIRANGSSTCYVHNDALGRLTRTCGTTGTCQAFRYDNSPGVTGTRPSGIVTNNSLGRMVEAETDNGTAWPPTTASIITDEWFSYDADGHVTDIWELTPHSGMYYHSHATYAGNGAILSVQLENPSLYTETYGLDGEGRLSTLKGNSTTVVSGTTFNAASQPTYIDLGTGTDQDDYVYDPNTGRMTNWTFQVGNTSSETGALTWNPNGTLKKLAINDGFNAGGTQTCNFNPTLATGTGYDDIGRLVGIDCGSGGWGQTFSYDQYDNLTKTVISGRTGVTWNPGYNSANNHYSSGASYDNSGNLTNDSIHTYTWDGYNKLSTVDSSACGTNGECVTYDAFGRIVETSYNSVYTEIWYTQLGKVYMTGGTTPYYAYWPTPGNGTVEVNGNAVTFYYMHKDWLGNARISSVIVNPAVVSDQAYAPYGEVYNKLATGAGVPAQMFTGDTQDIIGGIFDTPNRELNASQGRWLSPDPAGAGWNQYAYVTNPNSQIDPTGLCGRGGDDSDATGCDQNQDLPDSPSATQTGQENIKNMQNPSVTADLYYFNPGWGDFKYGTRWAGYAISQFFGWNAGKSALRGSNLGFNPATGGDRSDIDISTDMVNNANALAPALGQGNDFMEGAIVATGIQAGIAGAVFAGPAVATNLAARGLGWYYAYFGAGAGGVVLGQYPEYLDAAEGMGAQALNVPDRIYSFFNSASEFSTLNQSYLNAQMFRNQTFFLSNTPLGVPQSTGLWMELQHLSSSGIGPQQWQYVPLRFMWY